MIALCRHCQRRRAALDYMLGASLVILIFALGLTAARFMVPSRTTLVPAHGMLPRALPQSPAFWRAPAEGYEI